MRRKPFAVIQNHELSANGENDLNLGSRWLDALEAAILLKRFKRRDRNTPSVGAIRNMVYRGQLQAYRFFGRRLFDRYEIERMIAASPFKKGT